MEKLKKINKELSEAFKDEPNKNKILGFTMGVITKHLPELVNNLPIQDVSMSDVIFDCGTCGNDISHLGFCPRCDTQAHSY